MLLCVVVDVTEGCSIKHINFFSSINVINMLFSTCMPLTEDIKLSILQYINFIFIDDPGKCDGDKHENAYNNNTMI